VGFVKTGLMPPAECIERLPGFFKGDQNTFFAYSFSFTFEKGNTGKRRHYLKRASRKHSMGDWMLEKKVKKGLPILQGARNSHKVHGNGAGVHVVQNPKLPFLPGGRGG